MGSLITIDGASCWCQVESDAQTQYQQKDDVSSELVNVQEGIFQARFALSKNSLGPAHSIVLLELFFKSLWFAMFA